MNQEIEDTPTDGHPKKERWHYWVVGGVLAFVLLAMFVSGRGSAVSAIVLLGMLVVGVCASVYMLLRAVWLLCKLRFRGAILWAALFAAVVVVTVLVVAPTLKSIPMK